MLLGHIGSNYDEGKQLHSVKEVADFILTHGDVLITEEDGAPLLEIKQGDFLYCNDMRYRDALMSELRKGEGFEDNHINVECSHLRRRFLKK